MEATLEAKMAPLSLEGQEGHTVSMSACLQCTMISSTDQTCIPWIITPKEVVMFDEMGHCA
jgi:hypothetical protein